jgi:hypothetical protein
VLLIGVPLSWCSEFVVGFQKTCPELTFDEVMSAMAGLLEDIGLVIM